MGFFIYILISLSNPSYFYTLSVYKLSCFTHTITSTITINSRNNHVVLCFFCIFIVILLLLLLIPLVVVVVFILDMLLPVPGK